MSWTIDPNSFVLVHSEGRSDFTAAEFARQEWPPCPVCGTPVVVDPIDTSSLANRDSVMPGQWECPQGHDPRVGRAAP